MGDFHYADDAIDCGVNDVLGDHIPGSEIDKEATLHNLRVFTAMLQCQRAIMLIDRAGGPAKFRHTLRQAQARAEFAP